VGRRRRREIAISMRTQAQAVRRCPPGPSFRGCWCGGDCGCRCGRVVRVGGKTRYVDSTGCFLLQHLAPSVRPVVVCATVRGRGRSREGIDSHRRHGGTVQWHGGQRRYTLHAIRTCTDSLRFAVPMAVHLLLPVFCAFLRCVPVVSDVL